MKQPRELGLIAYITDYRTGILSRGGKDFEENSSRRRRVQGEDVRGNGAIGAMNHASVADEGNIAACNRGS
jgi:hypothetical protein